MPVVPIGDFGRINNGNIPNPTFAITAMMGVLDSAITFTRASAATYYNSSGIITSAGNNVARFDYNPTTLALNGLLIEESRTNALKSSGAVGDANWTNQAQTVTQNSGIAPDGTNTAALMAVTIVAFPDSQQSSGSSASGNYAVSCYVKQGTNPSVWMSLSDNVANSAGSLFTFSGASFTNGVVGNGSVVSTTAQTLPNGWIRLSYILNFSGVGGANFSLTIGPWTSTGGGATLTNTVLVWGAQAETGQAFATSYIPSTSAAATRAVDSAKVTSIPWYNAVQGSVVTNFIPENSMVSSPYRIFSFDDGTANNTINSLYNNGSLLNLVGQLTVAGVSQNSLLGSTLSANLLAKMGLVYNAGNNLFSVNGSSPSANAYNTSSSIPAGITTLVIGNRSDGTRSNNAWYQSFTYYNSPLTSSQLNAKTT